MPRLWKRKPELLLLPNIPKPMHGVNPRTMLGRQWWDIERKAAYASTNYHCEACGVHKSEVKFDNKWLEGHEVYDTDYYRGTLRYIRTTPLCPCCHQFIHSGRLEWLLHTRQISRSRFLSVIQHGDAVLAAEGLRRPTLSEREDEIKTLILNDRMAEWSEWRLVVNGKRYPPKYKSYQEWEREMKKSDR